jgi:hypothetical protein
MAGGTGAATQEQAGHPHEKSDGAHGAPSNVSIDALADRVYRLMLRDLERERARGARGLSTPRR